MFFKFVLRKYLNVNIMECECCWNKFELHLFEERFSIAVDTFHYPIIPDEGDIMLLDDSREFRVIRRVLGKDTERVLLYGEVKY